MIDQQMDIKIILQKKNLIKKIISYSAYDDDDLKYIQLTV